jgi:hypothetical protein
LCGIGAAKSVGFQCEGWELLPCLAPESRASRAGLRQQRDTDIATILQILSPSSVPENPVEEFLQEFVGSS